MTFEQDWGIGLVQATENLDEMLRVVENGRVTCCIGFEATFFSQGPTEDARNRVVDAYELYVQAIGPDKLRWGEDPKAGEPPVAWTPESATFENGASGWLFAAPTPFYFTEAPKRRTRART